MKKSELDFRNTLTVLDSEFAEYMLEYDYNLLELDGLTKINPFTFQKDYWTKPTEDVTINPNANLGNTGLKKSFVNLVTEMNSPVNKLSALVLIRKYGNKRGYDGSKLVEAIVTGKIYHHNLTLYPLPYCVGLSLHPIVFEGLPYGNLTSNTPKRPSSFVNLSIRYIQMASNLFAGATALTDFFANYSYYTKITPNYTDKQRENDMQNLIHGVTDEVRISGQSPFTNISICSPETLRNMLSNYVWNSYKVDDLIEEIMKNQMIYVRFFSKGVLGQDRKPIGLPYRFPITTFVADQSFQKEYPEEWREILESNSNLCYLNILNNYKTDLKTLAMCCRLTQNLEDLLELNINSTFGSYLQVGSHAVVTINLCRISLETKDETKFLEILRERLEMARQLLLIHRIEILQKRRIKFHYFFKTGKLDLKHNFFSTIGFLGIADAIEYLGMKITEPAGLAFAKKILSEFKEASIRFSKEDGFMFNVEEVPGETAVGTLAKKDKMLLKGEKDFYNTQFVPLSYDTNILDRIRIEGELQSFCTGGSISHLNVDGMMMPETCYKFTMKILENSNLNHFALNKGFTICDKKHISQNVVNICPECGSGEVDWITRIVGYYVPTSAWNRVKQHEFKTRKWKSAGEGNVLG